MHYVQVDEIIFSIEDGDVICRLGDRAWAGFFKELSPEDKRFSHLGIEGTPFDWKFDMEEDNCLYCSELLYVILKKLDTNIVLRKVWIKGLGKNVIPLDVCSQSEYFAEVGYWG